MFIFLYLVLAKLYDQPDLCPFFQDFIDVTGADRLEDVGLEVSASATEDSSSQTATGLEGISASEMELVCSVHHTVFTGFSQADWIEGTEEVQAGSEGEANAFTRKSSDGVVDSSSSNKLLLSPALMAYQIGAEMVKSYSDVLGAFFFFNFFFIFLSF